MEPFRSTPPKALVPYATSEDKVVVVRVSIAEAAAFEQKIESSPIGSPSVEGLSCWVIPHRLWKGLVMSL